MDGKELEVLRSASATIERTRPVIYLENDEQEKSAGIFEYLMERGYNLYWHLAGIYEPGNFFGNPVNHWSPQAIMSKMMLCLPSEKAREVSLSLRQVTHRNEWWEGI